MTITPESVQELINSADFGDRIRGINQLRQLEPQQALMMIKPLITDPNTRVRYAAVSQLDTLGKHDLAACLELLRDRLRYDSEADVKAAAADAIGGLQLTEAFEDLQQLYRQSQDWLIKFSIIAALGELGDSRGFALLEEALAADNSLVKIAAISAFGELGDRRAVPLLLPLATDEDWQMRFRLAQALGHLGGAEAQLTLAELAQDSFPQVAQEAQNYLKD